MGAVGDLGRVTLRRARHLDQSSGLVNIRIFDLDAEVDVVGSPPAGTDKYETLLLQMIVQFPDDSGDGALFFIR